jgi:formylglycine-generating enzyme required for sulfatase activity
MGNYVMSTFDLPEFVSIPTTTFLMGTPESDLSRLAKAYGGTRESYREESPQHHVHVTSFAISKNPITVATYRHYVDAGGTAPAQFERQLAHPDLPVVNITWIMARAFCAWVQDTTGHVYRLPTEAEWECAARGTDGRQYPWGNTFDITHATTRESGVGLTPVASYPSGASPWGVLDMAGSVWEWTESLDLLYPYSPDDGRNDPSATGRRVIRGGCYVNPQGYARCACRFRMAPDMTNPFLGFRIVTAPS